LASVHKFNATTVKKVFTANVLADYVNIVNKPTSLVTFINGDYLAHALLKYCKVLERKFGWITYQKQDNENMPQAVGGLTGKRRSVSVMLPQIDWFSQTPDTFETRAFEAQKRLSTIPPCFPSLIYLAKGKDPSFIYGEKYPTAGEVAVDSSVKIEVKTEQGKEKGPFCVGSKAHDTLGMVARLPSRGVKTEAAEYVQKEKALKSNGTACYMDNGIMPTIKTRFEKVKASMPELHAQITENIVSARGIEKNVGRNNKNSEKSDTYLEKVQLISTEFSELIVAAHAGGTCLTPALVTSGLIQYAGGLTRSCFEIQTQRKMSCSYASAKKIANSWMRTKQTTLLEDIQNLKPKDQCLLVVLDNYVVMQFHKIKHTDEQFTEQCPTIAVLFCALAVSAAAAILGPKPSACVPLNYEIVERLLCSTDPALRGIKLTAAEKAMRDVNFTYQGLRNFDVYGNIDGKSSSMHDTEFKVIGDLLEQVAGMGRREVAVVVDTEYILSFLKLVMAQRDRMKNMVLLPMPFHIRMHLVNNFTNDPCFLLLLYLPFLYAIGLQRDKIKEKVKIIIKKIEAFLLKPPEKPPDPPQLNTAQDTIPGSESSDINVPEKHANPPTPDTKESSGPETENEDTENEETGQNVLGMLQADIQAEEGGLLDEEDGQDGQDGQEDGELGLGEEFLEQTVFPDHLNALGKGASLKDDLYTPDEWTYVRNLVYTFIKRGGRETVKDNAFNYKDKQSTSINYARNLYATQMLTAAWQQFRGDEFVQCDACWAEGFCADTLTNGIGAIAIAPMAKIVLEGNATSFIESLHLATHYIAHCGREKVARALLALISTLEHYQKHRPDLMEMYLKNCTKANDNYVENHNSITQRNLPQNSIYTPELVKRAAEFSELKRSIKDKTAGYTATSSSKGKGEIYHEETRHTRGKGEKDKPRVIAWIRHHFEALRKIQDAIVTSTPSSSSESSSRESPLGYENPRPRYHVKEENWTGLDSIELCLENGRKVLEDIIIPNYGYYLDGIITKHNKATGENIPISGKKSAKMIAAEKAKANAPPLTFKELLEKKLSKPYYLAYLRYKDVKVSTAMKKEELVSKVLQNTTKEDFVQFVLLHKLDSTEKANRFLNNIAQFKQDLKQQARNEALREQKDKEDAENEETGEQNKEEKNKNEEHTDIFSPVSTGVVVKCTSEVNVKDTECPEPAHMKDTWDTEPALTPRAKRKAVESALK
jgi:hypothetical protein